jgi:AcrR family transcriptional regulator
MVRVVKEQEYAEKRNEILDAAQRLVFTKGYEQMSIQDILDTLGISKGAFYHYFDSKAALLEAYIERGQDEADKVFRAIVDDPALDALEKFRRFFASLDQMRRAEQVFITDLVKVWFADENAIVREKVDDAIVQRRVPLINAIVRQGVQEGVFTTPYPDQAGQVILAITRGMNNAILKLALALQQDRDDPQQMEEIVATIGAMAEAIERVLGSAAPILERPDADAVKSWLNILDREAKHSA